MQDMNTGARDLDTIRYQAAALSLAAGLLHLYATFDYWTVWAGYGLFFMLLALLQVTYGLVMFFQPWAFDSTGDRKTQPSAVERAFLLAGALVTGTIVVLWLVTHLAATPFGPMAGQRQPLTLLGAGAVLAMAAQTWYLLRLNRLILRAHREALGLPERTGARDD